MSMKRNFVIAGTLGTIWALSSCSSVDRCGPMGVPGASDCSADMRVTPQTGDFLVSPLRIPLSAAKTTLSLSKLPKNVSLSFFLKKDGSSSVPLTTTPVTTPNGDFQLDISSQMTKGLTSGKAQIEFTISGGSPKTSPVWLFRDANLMYKGSFSTMTDMPRWVGIGNQVVYVINEYKPIMTIYRKLEAYTYSATAPYLRSKPQFANQNALRSDMSAGITDKTIILAYGDAAFTSTYIIACMLDMPNCNDGATSVSNTYGRVQAVSADRSSSLYAVSTEAFTDKLDIYAIASNLPTGKSVSLDQPPASGVAIKAVGFGQFNITDALSDLLVWQFNGQGQNAATVYLQQTAGGLKRDQAASTNVQTLLGTTDVDALTVADLDMDGLDDIIIARGNTIAAFANQADGSWKMSATIPLPFDISATDKVTGIAVGQLDADSFPDLVVSSATGKKIGVYINQ